MLSANTSTPTASQEIESKKGFQSAPADNGPMDLPRLWSLEAKIISAQKAWIMDFNVSVVSSLNVSFILFKGLLKQIIMQYLSGIKVKFRFAQKCWPRGACLWSIQLFKAIVGSTINRPLLEAHSRLVVAFSSGTSSPALPGWAARGQNESNRKHVKSERQQGLTESDYKNGPSRNC